MGHKRQFPAVFNWQSVSPVTGFLPLKANQTGSAPSGVVNGTMSSTNTIYSQIIDLSLIDCTGLETTWTGTPTGVISVLGSCSGINFYALSGFSPAITQPAGSDGGGLINLADYGFKYILLQYVNTSGSGSLTVYGQMKDWS